MAKITFPHSPSNNITIAGFHMEAGICAPVSLPWGCVRTHSVGTENSILWIQIYFSIQKYNILGKP